MNIFTNTYVLSGYLLSMIWSRHCRLHMVRGRLGVRLQGPKDEEEASLTPTTAWESCTSLRRLRPGETAVYHPVRPVEGVPDPLGKAIKLLADVMLSPSTKYGPELWANLPE